MTDLTPIAPQPGDTLRVTGTLHNTSNGSINDLAVQLRYNSAHIGSRSEFDGYVGGGPLPLPPLVAASTAVVLPQRELAAGSSEPFAISVPMVNLTLDGIWQVFELGVDVVGSATQGFGTVGALRTVLPWAPVGVAGVGLPTRVAWLWPLVDAPHRTVGPAFVDDALARSFGPGGRLAGLVSAAAAAATQRAPTPPVHKGKHAKPAPPSVPVSAVPVTWAIDPMLVQDATLMSAGYRVGSGQGTGTAVAKTWLAGLRAATNGAEVIALPYADPDIVAADRSHLEEQVQVALHTGESLLASELAVSPLAYSWPPNGLLDQHTLDTLFNAQVTTVVVGQQSLPYAFDPSVTPSAHTTVRARDGNLDALELDDQLDAAIATGVANPADERLAVQRYLGETLMIQAERPFTQRTVVVAPERRWTPGPTYAATLLDDTGRVPWIQPVTVGEAAQTEPSTGVTRLGLTYPNSARHAELTRDYLSGVRALQADADTFAAILAPGEAQAREFDDAVLRSLSSAWRGREGNAQSFRGTVADELNATKRKVRIASAPGSFVTLTSHTGTVPITVSNELDAPVRVAVQISSQHLQVSGGGRVAETIQPHRQVAIDVRATARTSGVFPLEVNLLTPNGLMYDHTNLLVRSTAYGVVALLITGLATGILLLAVVIRLVRRARAARRPAEQPA